MKNALGEWKLESGNGKTVGAGREGGGGPAAAVRLLGVLWAIECLGSPATNWEWRLNGSLCSCFTRVKSRRAVLV